MVSEKNGTNGTMKILGWVGGTTLAVLTIGLTIYSTFHVPLANAVSIERDQRISGDNCLDDKIQLACVRYQEDRAAIKEQLAVIMTKLDNIEKKVQ